LGIREAEIRGSILENILFRMVSTEKLGKISDNRIVDDIKGNDLTIELLFP
jgi:hypothetical protein